MNWLVAWRIWCHPTAITEQAGSQHEETVSGCCDSVWVFHNRGVQQGRISAFLPTKLPFFSCYCLDKPEVISGGWTKDVYEAQSDTKSELCPLMFPTTETCCFLTKQLLNGHDLSFHFKDPLHQRTISLGKELELLSWAHPTHSA